MKLKVGSLKRHITVKRYEEAKPLKEKRHMWQSPNNPDASLQEFSPTTII